LQANSSDTTLLMVFGVAGIALVTMDGLRTRDEIARLVDRMMLCAMFMVGVGLVQFFFSFDLTRYVRPPGLQLHVPGDEADIAVNVRSIFNRPHGTTLHAIEFGVVSAALAPLAYWVARRHRTWLTSVPVAALGFGAMVSLSRSAVLAAAVAAVVVLSGTSWRQRATILVFTCVFVVFAGLMVDGLVGTLRSLFTTADSDPSVQARINRIPRVVQLISEHPWFGRGLGTFTIDDDFLLDNEIQKTVIESGFVGVAVLVVFIGFVAVIAARSRVGTDSDRLLGTALMATILGLFISSYTFDAFFYRILTGVMYLSIGIVGALYRITKTEREAAERAWFTKRIEELPTVPRRRRSDR
jgi:O-antigen ligase